MMGSSGSAGQQRLPEVPLTVDSLRRDMEEALGRGRVLGTVVQVLADGAPASAIAAAALEIVGAAWKTHVQCGEAGTILAGDALLTRALELGTTLPDTRCRRAFLTYVTRAFSAAAGGGKFLLGAAVEIGAAMGGWTLERAEGTSAGPLAELVSIAGGPLIVPHETERHPGSVQAPLAAVLESPELNDWR
jgi:hypothetical protein